MRNRDFLLNKAYHVPSQNIIKLDDLERIANLVTLPHVLQYPNDYYLHEQKPHFLYF